MFSTLNFRALTWATAAVAALAGLVFVGSRGLQNFDAALVPYLVGTFFATLRHRLPLCRLAAASAHAALLGAQPRADVLAARAPLGAPRPRARACRTSPGRRSCSGAAAPAAWRTSSSRGAASRRSRSRCRSRSAGCTSRWSRGPRPTYQAHLFGFPVFSFPLGSFVAFNVFHALNWSSLMVLAGVALLRAQAHDRPGPHCDADLRVRLDAAGAAGRRGRSPGWA